MTEKELNKILASKRNLFITGPAGTGKSYLLNKYIENCGCVCAVCAPTGIAALHVGGDTMHRLFHVPVPCYETPSFAKGNKKAVPPSVLRTLAAVDTIIIDEISMCRNDVFRYAVKVLRKAEALKGSKIRLIVSGDFSQLPPVIKKGDDKLLKKAGLDPSGFPFTTMEWKSMNFKVVELVDIYRQDDIEFIENLNRIRVGDSSGLAYFDQFVREGVGPVQDAVTVCGTNAEADRINTFYLEDLDGPVSAYMAKKEGHVPANMVSEAVLLKEGARVMFTATDVRGRKYTNGMFGVVKRAGSDSVLVTTADGDVLVYPQEWPVYNYSLTKGVLDRKEIGSVKQMPLRLGKAITIHKSQGQTFEKAVVSPDVFAPGQLYVALSRVKGPAGLILTRKLTYTDLILDETVRKFYEDGYKWEPKRKAVKSKTTSAAPKKTVSKTGTSAKASAAKKATSVKKSAAKKPVKKAAGKTAVKAKPKAMPKTKSKTGTRSAGKTGKK